MILLDGLPTKLFISEKPNNPPIDLYMTGIIRKLEERREEDLQYIEKLKTELEFQKRIIKGSHESIENMSFELDEKKDVIERLNQELKNEREQCQWLQEDLEKSKKTNLVLIDIKELKEERIQMLENEIEVLKSKNKSTIPDAHWHTALDTEREKRLQLQITLSSVTELVRRLNNVIA